MVKGPSVISIIAVVIIILAAMWFTAMYVMPEKFVDRVEHIKGRPMPYPFGADTFINYDEKKKEDTK